MDPSQASMFYHELDQSEEQIGNISLAVNNAEAVLDSRAMSKASSRKKIKYNNSANRNDAVENAPYGNVMMPRPNQDTIIPQAQETIHESENNIIPDAKGADYTTVEFKAQEVSTKSKVKNMFGMERFKEKNARLSPDFSKENSKQIRPLIQSKDHPIYEEALQ